MSTTSQLNKILREAKKSRFEDHTKGTTVVKEKHFANKNEELSFAKFYSKFSGKKGIRTSIR